MLGRGPMMSRPMASGPAALPLLRVVVVLGGSVTLRARLPAAVTRKARPPAPVGGKEVLGGAI